MLGKMVHISESPFSSVECGQLAPRLRAFFTSSSRNNMISIFFMRLKARRGDELLGSVRVGGTPLRKRPAARAKVFCVLLGFHGN